MPFQKGVSGNPRGRPSKKAAQAPRIVQEPLPASEPGRTATLDPRSLEDRVQARLESIMDADVEVGYQLAACRILSHAILAREKMHGTTEQEDLAAIVEAASAAYEAKKQKRRMAIASGVPAEEHDSAEWYRRTAHSGEAPPPPKSGLVELPEQPEPEAATIVPAERPVVKINELHQPYVDWGGGYTSGQH